GSIAIYKDTQVACDAVLRPDTIETTGAGDTFMGCMLNYVLEHGIENLTEDDLRRMQQFAAMAASIITTRKGALKVMPTKNEIRADEL
ncbi:MAG: PfkB family carbohydrate kinase, partial [Wujia sp.]